MNGDRSKKSQEMRDQPGEDHLASLQKDVRRARCPHRSNLSRDNNNQRRPFENKAKRDHRRQHGYFIIIIGQIRHCCERERQGILS